MGRNCSGYWCSFEVVPVTINTYLLRHSLLAAILNRNGCHIEVFWLLFIIGVWQNFRGTFISNGELALFEGDLGESVWADLFECHDLKCIAALSIVVNDHGGEL